MPGVQNTKKTLDFLGTIGSTDRGDDLKLNNTAKALVRLSDFLIDEATNNLRKKGNIASGGTEDSMKADNIEINGTKMSLDILIVDTYKFLDQGVKGVEGGQGKYSFKTKYPNEKMAKAIRAWLRYRKVATKYKAISKTESKNKKIQKIVKSAEGKLTGLSYAIATNIKKKGIKATKFFSNAIKATEKQAAKEYAEAFRLDIIESLNGNN